MANLIKTPSVAEPNSTTMLQRFNALRVSPAAHLSAAMTQASHSTAQLREIPYVVQLGVRCALGTPSADAVQQELGLQLPERVGETTGDAAAAHLLWISPDEFLFVDVSRQALPGEELDAAAALTGLPGQIVDLSANRTILELSGSSARTVLEHGCRSDLRPRSLPVGAAIATQLAHVPLLIHHAKPEVYRLFPRASFADFTVRWLLDAMRSAHSW